MDQDGVDAARALARASRVLERSSDELVLAHYRVLAAVASGEVRATRVASRLALGKPAVSAAVDALCQRGLMLRAAADGDQRGFALSVTPTGRALLTRVETAMVDRLRALASRTPDPDQVLTSLAWLGDAMDQLMAEQHP